MLTYRSFPYYFMLTFFIMGFFFSHSVEDIRELLSEKYPSFKTLQKKKKPKQFNQIIQLLDANTAPDKSQAYFLSPRSSRGINTSNDTEDNSSGTRNPSSAFNLQPQNTAQPQKQEKKQDLSKGMVVKNFNEDLQAKKQKKINQKTLTQRQPKSVAGQKISIKMDQDGHFSVNSLNFKNAQYLIDIAQETLQYWIQFIPGQTLYNGFLKEDRPGIMEGSVQFDLNKDGKYDVTLTQPFISETLNEFTLSGFKYYIIKKSNKAVLQQMTVQLTIHRDTLKVEGSFQFEMK